MSQPKAVIRPAVPLLLKDPHAAAGPPGLTNRQVAARIAVLAVLLAVAMVLLGFLVTHSLAHRWPLSTEDSVDRALAARRDPALNTVTGALSTMANTAGTAIAAAAACLATRRLFRRWREAAFVAACLAVEVGVFLVTTVLVHRSRPLGLELDHSPPTSSFPSGHSAAALALYGALAWLLFRWTRRRSAWLLLLVPAAVGFARLYRGMHHPSDVIAGFLLGACAVWIANRAVLRPEPARPPLPAVRKVAAR